MPHEVEEAKLPRESVLTSVESGAKWPASSSIVPLGRAKVERTRRGQAGISGQLLSVLWAISSLCPDVSLHAEEYISSSTRQRKCEDDAKMEYSRYVRRDAWSPTSFSQARRRYEQDCRCVLNSILLSSDNWPAVRVTLPLRKSVRGIVI